MSNIPSFKKFISHSSENYIIHSAIDIYFESLEQPYQLSEAYDFKALMHKFGIHTQKGSGVVQIMSKASKNIAALFWYAIKASLGDEGAKDKVREIATKEVTHAQVLDFLLRVDALSMHILTGPIHMIDAVMGWHIGVELHNIAKGHSTIDAEVAKAKEILSSIKSKADESNAAIIDSILKTIDSLTLSAQVAAA